MVAHPVTPAFGRLRREDNSRPAWAVKSLSPKMDIRKNRTDGRERRKWRDGKEKERGREGKGEAVSILDPKVSLPP